MNEPLILQVLPGTYSVCKLLPSASIDDSLFAGDFFYSVTRTNEELSIICSSSKAARFPLCEDGWKVLKIKGVLDFSLTGILLSVIAPLAEWGISIFTVSTYNTDYILVKEDKVKQAAAVLSKDFIIRDLHI